MKCNGHLMPCPLTLPKDNGISTFIDCAYTAKQKTTTVDAMPAIISIAVCGSPAARLWNNAGIAPVATPGLVGDGKGDNSLMKSDCETPATINRLTPEPKP